MRGSFSGWRSGEPEAHQASLGAEGSVGMLKRPLMPGARSKRCRQARPLTRPGTLAARKRPGPAVTVINAEPRSLSARSADPAVSRAASPAPLARRNAGVLMEPRAETVGRSNDQVKEAEGKGSAFFHFHECERCPNRSNPKSSTIFHPP